MLKNCKLNLIVCVSVSLVGQSAPPEFLQKLTYLVLRHHPKIKRVDTVRAYTFGVLYFVEVSWSTSLQLHLFFSSGLACLVEPSFSVRLKLLMGVWLWTFCCWTSLLQIDIELPEDLPLKEAHYIGESLQIKIEELPHVERAFVHLDYECNHKPEHSVLNKLPNNLDWFWIFFKHCASSCFLSTIIIYLEEIIPFLFWH